MHFLADKGVANVWALYEVELALGDGAVADRKLDLRYAFSDRGSLAITGGINYKLRRLQEGPFERLEIGQRILA